MATKDVNEKLLEKLGSLEIKQKEEQAKKKAAALQMPYISLIGFPIGAEVLALLSEEEARKYGVIPFFYYEKQIRIATTDPRNPEIKKIIDELGQKVRNAEIGIYLTSEHSFKSAFRLYASVTKIRTTEHGVRITEEQLMKYRNELKTLSDLEQAIPGANMTDVFAMIFGMGINIGASDIHMEAEENDIVVRYRIDGILQVGARVPKDLWHQLISRLKTLAGLKLNVSDVPQDGHITIVLSHDKIDIRISTLPETWGESVVMRLLRESFAGIPFESLGLRNSAERILLEEMKKPNGMIITTGPTGSGKTTTLYAIVNKLNRPEVKIITLENPIEYKLPGIIQSQVDTEKDYTFGNGLRALLRQDPDICLVGEIRDIETAETAIQAALTGHLLLSTLHTNDATGAIPRFLSMGVKPFLLSPALNAVMGQRLVRKICTSCKTEAKTSPEIIEKAKKLLQDIPENSGEKIPDLTKLTFFQGRGCEKCQGLGYKGRIGIYEIFRMNPDIEKLTLTGQASEYQMRDLTRAAGMVSMAQDGVLKALDGITTLEEIFRVTG